MGDSTLEPSNLQCDILVSKFAFEFIVVYHYSEAAEAAADKMHETDLHTSSKKDAKNGMGGARPMKDTTEVGPAMDQNFLEGTQVGLYKFNPVVVLAFERLHCAPTALTHSLKAPGFNP